MAAPALLAGLTMLVGYVRAIAVDLSNRRSETLVVAERQFRATPGDD